MPWINLTLRRGAALPKPVPPVGWLNWVTMLQIGRHLNVLGNGIPS
jgi:hypothetical protein